MLLRRLSIVSGLAAATVALSAGSAFAHGCYFTDPNPNADANRANTPAFMSLHDMAVMFTGLCPEGIAVLEDAAGVNPDTLINVRGMMAGGSGGNKAIKHLDFDAIDAAMPAAEIACGGGE